MSVIPVIVEQHTEESAFLWLLRDCAVYEPHYALPDLAKLDDRIEAHIDGLKVAGDEGWEIYQESMMLDEVGEIFTRAFLAFESGKKNRIKAILETGYTDPELSRGIVSALGWLSYEQVEVVIKLLSSSELPDLRRIGIAGYAVHRQDPGKILHEGIFSIDSSLKARTLKAIGELGKKELAYAIKDHMNDEDEICRYYAAETGVLIGSMTGLPILQNIAETGELFAERACSLAFRRMSIAEGNEWIRALAKKKNLQRIALIGAGSMGDPVLIPWLIRYMSIPEMARVSGESFSMITGVDLAYEDLDGEWLDGFEAGPTDDPNDDNVELDPDENLPWPNPELIDEWWGKNKGNFRDGIRYICGKPISEQQCLHVLKYGYQRQRAAAAIELTLMKPGLPLFNVKAPGFRQQRFLNLK